MEAGRWLRMRHAFKALLKNKENFLVHNGSAQFLQVGKYILHCCELSGNSSFQGSKPKCAGRCPKQAQDDIARQCLSEWDNREHILVTATSGTRLALLYACFMKVQQLQIWGPKNKKVLHDSNFYNKCKVKQICHPLQASLHTSSYAAIRVISKSNVLNPQTALFGHSIGTTQKKHAAQAWKPNVQDSPFAKTKQYKKTTPPPLHPAKCCEFQIIECKTRCKVCLRNLNFLQG